MRYCSNKWLLFFVILSASSISKLGGAEISLEETRTYAEKGNPKACYELGLRYLYGDGVNRDEEEGYKWHLKAAQLGNKEAQYSQGQRYHYGLKANTDLKEAAKWYHKAAMSGHAAAQLQIGMFYESGIGVEKDQRIAMKWFKTVVQNGLLSISFRRPTQVDHALWQAIHKVAASGDSNAQYELATFYADHMVPESALLTVYSEGLTLEQHAFRWYTKAADSGVLRAQINLALCYEKGKGTPKDYVEAVKWYQKAGEEGNPLALYYVGKCYAESIGVANDDKEAYAHLNIAAINREDAKSLLSEIERRMTPQDRLLGQKRTKEIQKAIDAKIAEKKAGK